MRWWVVLVVCVVGCSEDANGRGGAQLVDAGFVDEISFDSNLPDTAPPDTTVTEVGEDAPTDAADTDT